MTPRPTDTHIVNSMRDTLRELRHVLPTEICAPANCALATVVNALDMARLPRPRFAKTVFYFFCKCFPSLRISEPQRYQTSQSTSRCSRCVDWCLMSHKSGVHQLCFMTPTDCRGMAPTRVQLSKDTCGPCTTCHYNLSERTHEDHKKLVNNPMLVVPTHHGMPWQMTSTPRPAPNSLWNW